MIKYLVPSEAAFSTLRPWPSDSVLSPSPCSGVNTNTDALVSIHHWLWPQDPRGQMLRLTSMSPALSWSMAYSWHLEGLFWKFPWLCWAHKWRWVTTGVLSWPVCGLSDKDYALIVFVSVSTFPTGVGWLSAACGACVGLCQELW